MIDNSNVFPIRDLRPKRVRRALDEWHESSERWIEATMALALELKGARDECGQDDRRFGHWLVDNDCNDLSYDTRAALINMGDHVEITREVLQTTDRDSVRLIWEQEIKPKLTHVSQRCETSPSPEQYENRSETPTITAEIVDSASEKEALPVAEITQSQPEPVSKKTLAKLAVGAFPKAELVLAHVLNKDTRTLLGRIAPKNKKNGGPIWQLLVRSIESGAYGPPGTADVSKPNLRLILPWASVSYAQRFDLTKAKDQKITGEEILPVVIANRAELTESPDRLSALVYEAATAPRRLAEAEAAKEKHAAAISQMSAGEREVVAFGVVLWPRPADDHAYAFTYDELCHAVWFSQMLFGSYPPDWKPLSKTMQTAHLIKFVEPMLKASGWAVAVRDIFSAYANSPEGECKFPSPPINFGSRS